jgi:TonB family protein
VSNRHNRGSIDTALNVIPPDSNGLPLARWLLYRAYLMTIHCFISLALFAVWGPPLAAQVGESSGPKTVARILASSLPSPQDIAVLQTRVQQNPEDLDSRIALLRFYRDTAPVPPNDDPARRSVRLQHILYFVQRHPEAPASAARVAYVYRSDGPYANVSDHEAVRSQWLAAVQAHPGDAAVVVNAAKFLAVENKSDAEDVLRRGMAVNPENGEIAAALGFLYAMEILGLDSLVRGTQPTGHGPDLSGHALAELDQTSNAWVLAAAGTALPNLAIAATAGRLADPKIFDLASTLSSKARQIAPADPDIQGPMPMIRYFSAAQQETRAMPEPGSSPTTPPSGAGSFGAAPSRIRVAGNVEAGRLVRKTVPRYPEEAKLSGIKGEVRFAAVIGRDGTIQSLELLSGHPLLVAAALDAVKTWLYQPMLLNGMPVEVATEIVVSFPM